MQVCQEHLGISPVFMLTTHANSLRCSPRNAAARVAFLASRKQLDDMGSLRFLKDSEGEWSRRLRVLKVPWQGRAAGLARYAMQLATHTAW